MTEAERLYQIHAYLDLLERHIMALPDKTHPKLLLDIGKRLDDLLIMVVRNSAYSHQRRQDADEARERVSAMIGTVN